VVGQYKIYYSHKTKLASIINLKEYTIIQFKLWFMKTNTSINGKKNIISNFLNYQHLCIFVISTREIIPKKIKIEKEIIYSL
jgi:hypothetical protein